MINWWDLMMATVSIIFAFSLVPTVVLIFQDSRKIKIPIATSFPTFVGMLITVIFYICHGMIFATITSACTTLGWFFILVCSLV